MSGWLGYRVLDAAVASDLDEWHELWEASPGAEPSAHPAYASLFARPHDRVLCAAYRSRQGGVLFPVIARPLACEAWAEGEPGWDLTSPYGYGGPFAWGMSDDDATSFWDAHRSFVRSSRILSVFARLALFPEELLPFDGEVSVNAPNVVRDLSIGEEAIWRDYAHKVRKNVNRARANGLTVEIDLTGSAIDVFADVYWETMRRRSAAEGYFFGLEFFRRIVRDIQGGFAFFHVLAEDRVVSTELVLVSAQRLYSFLGGTREEALDLRANDLLKHEIIRWGCAQGKKAFVLGGGYGGADGIFKYKLGFAPQGETPFRVGKSVVDVASCDRLVELRREWERQSGRDWRPRENFFPSYRA